MISIELLITNSKALLPLPNRKKAKPKNHNINKSSSFQPSMEEEMMMVMKMRSQETSHDHHHHHNLKIPIITTTTCPTWKLYENPFYIFHNHQQLQVQEKIASTDQNKQIHKLQLPISSRKIAASFFDLTFMKPIMEAEIENNKVRSELECERKARKRMESLNRRLARELSEERRGREALEQVCEELARELSADKAEVSRMKREIEDERKMLRTAEVIREERLQMKLSDAKILLEEKISELETSRRKHYHNNNDDQNVIMSFGEKLRFLLGEKKMSDSDSANNNNNSNSNSNNQMQRMKSRGETENPHIKRGIKGFVEFPKVVRAIGCRSSGSSSKHVGSKLECQKAQLKILLKQKGTLRFNGLIAR